ncbi:hypothetical protein [Fluviicola taffensis]|uniref:Carboxypeptidase regulatory-like domain-containing protein n=1 Tax=Fluviicola taffensis (strain DSM 16823 / NCIMB 13979 / RW262) TaxID=755732 RepID=F2II98_FLUTR|nr:hypothetical protein [Fluviicola taffensis]AEA43807.1 hypothetical protein Fluta_1820 [Fluviicola taffensis DSM 16823]
MKFLLPLFMLTTIISCTKFGKTDTAKGRVLNPVTGEGVSGVELKLLKSTAGLPGGNKAVKTATTDGDGFYEISKAGLKGYSLSCNLPAEYYPVGWFIDGELKNTNTGNVGLKKGKTLHADFYAVPYGNLQININNTSCFDTNDELKIYRSHSIPSFYDNVPNPAIYNGCVNQTGNMNKAPMGWYKYNGTVTKNGIVTPKRDSIYLNKDETKVWNINY